MADTKKLLKLITGAIFLFVAIEYTGFLTLQIPSYIQYGNLQYFLLYFMPKVLPFFIISIYLLFPNPPPRPKLNLIYKSITISTIITAIIISIAAVFINWHVLNWLLTEDYNWSVSGWLTWNYAFFLIFALSQFRLKDTYFSFTFAAIAISAGGLLYELPVCYTNPQVYLHSTFPLIVNTQWISLAFLAWLLYSKQWKLNKIVLAALTIYFSGAILYMTFGNNLFFSNMYLEWLPRVPTVMLLCLLPFGLKKNIPCKLFHYGGH